MHIRFLWCSGRHSPAIGVSGHGCRHGNHFILLVDHVIVDILLPLVDVGDELLVGDLLVLVHVVDAVVDAIELLQVEDIRSPGLNAEEQLKVPVFTLSGIGIVISHEPVVDVLVRVVELV